MTDADDYPIPKAYTWYLLGVLMLLMIFAQMDRMIIGTLFPQLKHEWALSDRELGLLVSATYYAMAVFVIPAALMADRWSRTKAITLMGLTWTAATVACGLATRFLHLLVGRVFIGAGEGGYNAGAVSLLSGIFPERLRSTATSLFIASGTFGTMIGLGLGGFVAARWGWREAFFVVAAPGFAVVLLFALSARDFRTVALEVPDDAGRMRRLGIAEILRGLFATPSLVCAYLGLAGVLFVNAAVTAWIPSLFTRAEGLPMEQAVLRAGFILLAATTGAICGGVIVDRWKLRDPRMALRGPALFALLCASGYLLGFLFLAGPARLVALLIAAFMMLACMGPIMAASMNVIHPGLRATTVGVFNVVGQLIGGSGPIATGMLSDALGLPAALSIVCLAPLFSAIVLALGSRWYAADATRIPKLDTDIAR